MMLFFEPAADVASRLLAIADRLKTEPAELVLKYLREGIERDTPIELLPVERSLGTTI